MINIGDVLKGTINFNSSGSAYLQSDKLPKEIYISKANTNHALHLDLVKVLIVKGGGRNIEGVVTKIVGRTKKDYVGTINMVSTGAYLIPDSNKLLVDIFIPLNELNKAKDGQKAIVRIKYWAKNSKNPHGQVIQVLGDAGNNDAEIHSILHEYGLPYNFEYDVLAEAKSISAEITEDEILSRKDMRNVTTFTIDPEDAKDFDDALSVEWADGNIQVGVHIADVSHYLKSDTDLDKEAYRRGTSVYLVDRVVPMLPERLSNELCSLRPYEDKLCFSVIFTMDKDANILHEWFGKTIIHSNHRYTYEGAQMVIEDNSSVYGTDKCIIDLNVLANKLRKDRLKDGSLTFDKDEIRFKLVDGKPTDIIFKTSKDANKLIEEFMLLANKAVARILKNNSYPVISRVHEEPSTEKLLDLKKFIKEFDYDIRITSPQEIAKSLNKLLVDVKGKTEENLVSNLVVRTMQKAFYTTKNMGHYGLGFEDYAHFTSPIRRYPDIIVHRLLNRFLTQKPTPSIEQLEHWALYLSNCELKAQKAERESIKYMQSVYMSQRIGFLYKGIITSITEYGVFVELIENKVDGMVRVSEIQGDTYITDLKHYCVKGHNTGRVIRLGDEVLVQVTSVDIERKNINLMIAM